MESERHREQMHLLIDSLDDAWRDRDDVYVSGNMAVYFSETQARKNDFRAPDVFVVLDTHRGERKSWVVWEEEGRTPDVVIELTSPSTEDVDRGQKKTVYERLLRVPVYVIYDPFSARLDAYRLDLARRRYHPIEPDERGWVYCEPLGLHLGVVPGRRREMEAPWLRWIGRDGQVLPAPNERADRAEAELTRLREELRRRGG